MSTVNGFQVGSEVLKYNYESLQNYNTPNFSSSSSKVYAIGDYVMYNGKLYKCTTATTGGTWNVNNWAEAILTDDVTEQKNAISDLGLEEIQNQGNIIEAQGLTLTATQSALWNTSGQIVENTAYKYYQAINQPIAVEPGKTYQFFGIYNASTNAILILLDSNMQNGHNPGGVITADGVSYTIPDGYHYVCLSVNKYISNLSTIVINGDIGTGKYTAENIVLDDDQITQVVDNIPDDSITAEKTDYTELVPDPGFVDDTNLLTDVSWSSPGYMRLNNGTLAHSEYTTGYVASDFIPVVPGFKYRCTAQEGKAFTLKVVAFGDSKADGISINVGWTALQEPKDFVVPEGKTFISLNCEGNSGQNPAEGIYRRTQYQNEMGVEIPRLVFSGYKPFSGKTIVNFGDSIFGQARPPVDVSTYLANITGATVYNAGFGGCQMAQHAQAAYDPFSMYRLAYAIANNDWTLQDNALTTYASTLPSYYSETITMLKGLDFSEIDYVTIGYGINDFNNGASLEAQNTNGYEYCLDYSIQTLLTAFPQLRVFITTMTYGFDPNSTADTNSFTHTSWVDQSTHSYLDFVQAQFDVAKSYQLPVIDLYYDLGINKINKLQYFAANDGTHHIIAGRELIAEKMAHDLW